jgi:hypothetical protein
MRRQVPNWKWLVLLGAVLTTPTIAAQGHQHTPGMTHPTANAQPLSEGGQAAFAAISEIVARLEADPATDWSKVNLEGLRQHLIDMDRVTMQSRMVQREVPGGFAAEVTGSGEVTQAIRRMLTAHVAQMAAETGLKGSVESIAGGMRLTVVAVDANDAAAVARLRGLGPIGILVSGNHHGLHHEAMARGMTVH